MYTEDLISNDGRQTEVVEYLCTVPPHINRAIFSLALIVESIHLAKHHVNYIVRGVVIPYLSDLSTFVISSDKCYSIRIPNLLR